MRITLLFTFTLFVASLFAQDRLVFLSGSDSTLIVDNKTLHMQSPSGSLFLGKNAGASEGLEIGNTSVGFNAGYFNNLGAYNTLLGHSAGFGNVSGGENTYLGFATGEYAINGYENVGIGAFANRGNKGGQNVVIGTEAAILSQDVSEMVSIGYQSGFSNAGEAGTFIGYQAGLSNAAGDNLTSVGHSSGFSNSSGTNNTFLGANSGYLNTTAGGNTFLGSHSGWQNTGAENTFVGVSSGANNTGAKNIMIGFTAGLFSEDGKENVFVGHDSGRNNSSGSNNVFIGLESGLDNYSGTENVGIGTGALKNDTGNTSANPSFSVAVGFEAGRESFGDSNTFLGYSAGANNGGGESNTYVGRNAGSTSYGNKNTFVGYFAGRENHGGLNNVYLGYRAGVDVIARVGNVYIGHNVQGKGDSYELAIDNGNTPTPLISGEFDNDFLTVNGYLKISETAQQSFVTGGAGMYFEHDKDKRLGIINSLDYSIPNSIQGELLLDAPTSVGFQVNQPNYFLRLPTSINVGEAIARSWDTYSDIRIKSNIQEINYGLSTIALLNPVSYFQHEREEDTKQVIVSPPGENTIGLIAQEVYKIIPEAVTKPDDEATQLWTMDYEKIIPVLVKAIQELQAQVEELKKRNQE